MSIIEQAARRLEELRRSGLADAETSGAANEAAARVVHLPEPAASAAPAAQSRQVTLDLARLEREGFIVPNAPRSCTADEFRAIKRPLLANVRGESAAPIRRANCILVTSAVPGEGKTYTATNLALSMASEVDTRVLLIDADVIRPTVLTRLGLPEETRGLLDKLNEPQIPLSDLILRTNLEKLSLLPSGRADVHANERLASEGMRRFIDEIAARYQDRIVIFDAPPLLAAPETRVLASLVGQIVVVVEAQKTTQKTLHEALALLEACPVVHMMLNKFTGPGKAGYGYAYGAGETAAADA